jgi:hypothetical protein
MAVHAEHDALAQARGTHIAQVVIVSTVVVESPDVMDFARLIIPPATLAGTGIEAFNQFRLAVHERRMPDSIDDAIPPHRRHQVF